MMVISLKDTLLCNTVLELTETRKNNVFVAIQTKLTTNLSLKSPIITHFIKIIFFTSIHQIFFSRFLICY